MWQQVVGNVISHKDQSTSIFSLGYAVRTDDGICVTESGRDYLSNMGFSVRNISDEDRYSMMPKDPEFDF